MEKACKSGKILSDEAHPHKSHMREIFQLPKAAIKSFMRLTFFSLMASVADVLGVTAALHQTTRFAR